MSPPSGASPWNGIFGRVKRSKYNTIVELAPVSYIIPTDVDYVNLHVQPTYEEAFMHTLPMHGTIAMGDDIIIIRFLV